MSCPQSYNMQVSMGPTKTIRSFSEIIFLILKFFFMGVRLLKLIFLSKKFLSNSMCLNNGPLPFEM